MVQRYMQHKNNNNIYVHITLKTNIQQYRCSHACADQSLSKNDITMTCITLEMSEYIDHNHTSRIHNKINKMDKEALIIQ